MSDSIIHKFSTSDDLTAKVEANPARLAGYLEPLCNARLRLTARVSGNFHPWELSEGQFHDKVIGSSL
ncbi:MAG: hypothetical protein ACRERU_00095 [Methylococcales bacterium]